MERLDFFEVIRTYVGFGEADELALSVFHPRAKPHFQPIVDRFYERIDADPDAVAVMKGQAQIDRLKRTLVDWMSSGLTGPHDDAFFQRRKRIGRIHVEIDLPQRYMLTAMNVIRTALHEVAEESYADDRAARRQLLVALDKWMDLELAIMLETYKEDSESRLRRKERLASMGELAGTIGHELRNPLSVIDSSLYLLRRSVEASPRTARHLDKIESQVKIAGDTITDLLEMTRSRAASPSRTDVAELVKEAVSTLTVPEGIAIHQELEHGLVIDAEASLLRRALANLVSNSVAALLERGHGDVFVRAHSDGGTVVIEVADDGPGFPEEVLTRAFEPLVTGRPGGVGLGLALVRNVCERHGASVTAGNRPEGGAVVRIEL